MNTKSSNQRRTQGSRRHPCGLFAVALLWLACAIGDPPTIAAAECEVRFLTRNDADELDEGFRGRIIPRNGRYQKAVVQEALGALPPIACKAVRRVAFVQAPEKDGIIAFTNTVEMINDGRPADLIYFNDAEMPESQLEPRPVGSPPEDSNEINRLAALRSVVHEAIHVADHLLDSQRKKGGVFDEDPLDESLWSARALELARETVTRNLLQVSFRQEWERMHEKFANANLARAYFGRSGGEDLKDVEKLTGKRDPDGNLMVAKDQFGRPVMLKPAPLEFAGAGIMTRYGGASAAEDIAEMAASVLTRQWVESKGLRAEYWDSAVEDHACEALHTLVGTSVSADTAAAGTSIPPEVAAMYTKLGFLKSVGLIPDEGYKQCVGRLRFRGDGEGFSTYRVDDLFSRYSDNVKVALGRAGPSDPVVFKLTAEGMVGTTSGSHPARVEWELDVSPPAQLDALMGVSSWDHVGLDDVSFPRGIYFVGDRYKSRSRFRIRRTDTDEVVMEVSQGIALIGRANVDLVEGSIFVQRFFNFSGGLMSAIAGDQPTGEPTKIVFRWSPGGPNCQPGTPCEIP